LVILLEEYLEMPRVVEGRAPYDFVQKALDFSHSRSDALFVILIEFPVDFQKGKEIPWVVNAENVLEPIYVLTFPIDPVGGKVGGDGDVQLVSGPNAENEPSDRFYLKPSF
jgi:hypothetical protein